MCTKGILSFITPYTILKNQYYVKARKFILTNTSIQELIDFKGITVFKDATVDSIILSLKKHPSIENTYTHIFNIKNFQNNQYQITDIKQKDISKSKGFSFNVSVNDELIEKAIKKCMPLSEIVNFSQGIITGNNKYFISTKKNEFSVKVLSGRDFNRYMMKQSDNFITYDETKLHGPRKKMIFEKVPKLILRQTGAYPICTLDNEKHYTLDTVHNGVLFNNNFSPKYILTLLNSQLFRFFYENSINESGKVFAQVKIIYIDPLPIKIISILEQNNFTEIAEVMLNLNKVFSNTTTTFSTYLKSVFLLEKLSRKLQNWYELDFADFIKELNKAIKKTGGEKLSKLDEIDWMEVFETKKAEAQTLKAEIDKTDREIDQMVYKLYDLTEEEIQIVENS